MTHRERVLAALEHRQSDRVPMDLGSARFTGMVKPAYEHLRAHLGFGEPGPITDRMQQLVDMDERVLRYLDVDARAVSHGSPDHGGDLELGPGRYMDEWGVVRVQPAGCPYYDMEESPLAGEISAQNIARYRWPDPTDPGRVRGLRERVQRLREETDYAIIFNARFHLVHQTQYLRGFHDWYLDLGQNHDLFHALMQGVLEVLLELNRRALREVGDLVDIVAFGDDVGLQDRPVCSPALYRQMIRPYQERITGCIREHTKAKILYHTCGSVYRLIDDFIGIGVNALNPVQVTARNMEPERLKREFGERIAFWGGIDSQHVLPYGTPEDVAAEVRRVYQIMGPGGGYVLAAVHNIQPDVPPENILALFQAGRECRKETLSCRTSLSAAALS
ncbi:MAG TPA: uroporphyrinogen decarboxylase family protein [Bryobacteraceae bacterium]|nr:uroporphyrinogen decarboxylase family protein [Bryobacteraceae bacterium]